MFEQIKKDSSDAWDKFEEYAVQNISGLGIYGDDVFDKLNRTKIILLIGHLFLFFDKQRIVIQISYSSGWYYRITDIDRKFTINNVDKLFCGDRPEAWQAAIPKAFEILEEKSRNYSSSSFINLLHLGFKGLPIHFHPEVHEQPIISWEESARQMKEIITQGDRTGYPVGSSPAPAL